MTGWGLDCSGLKESVVAAGRKRLSTILAVKENGSKKVSTFNNSFFLNLPDPMLFSVDFSVC